MLPLTSDDSGASQLIGYVYTALISVLILSSMMLTSSTMLNGSVSNTAQEEAEQLALYFQLAVEDLLNTVREYPGSSPVMVLDTGIEVTVADGMAGFIRKSELSRDRSEQRSDRFAVGEKVDAKVTQIDQKNRKLMLCI